MARNHGDIERRVAQAAEAALAKRTFVTAIDVLVGVGWLEPPRVDEWRQGRVDHLEQATVANLGKISTAIRSFRRWAQARGLKPSETVYVARTRDRRPLRFRSAGGRALDPAALELLATAAIRHEDTRYDELLMNGIERESARAQAQDEVAGIPDGWRR